MTRRPVCLVCLFLMLCMCLADLAGVPLIRGNPLPETVQTYIKKHPDSVICGEVQRCQATEISFSVYLKQVYLICRSEKIPIENVRVFLKTEEELPAGTAVCISGKLEQVEAPRNPGEFDSRQYYACQHIYYFMKNGIIKRKSRVYSGYQQFLLDLKDRIHTSWRKKRVGSGSETSVSDGGNGSYSCYIRSAYQYSGYGIILSFKKNGPGKCRSRPSFSVCDASIWNAYRRKRVCHEGGVYVCPECRSKGSGTDL